jgi:chemotaxis family two-component system sensor kinase Cph1
MNHSMASDYNDLQMVSAEQRRTEKELQLKVAELERFTYIVSHDLKSPLITIQSYADMISQEMEAGNHARAQEDLKRVRNAASKMTHLLDDLLRLSRVGRKMNPPVQVNMNQVAKYVLSQLAGPIRLRQVEFVEQSELPAVRGDQRRIEEVLQNLVENAIKYMGDQPKPFIEIGAREEQGKHVFFVQDNGIGIDKRYHETIFGLFNKLDAKSEGTGIGLALVKQIIEVHGGRVWVESEGVGKGSRFCFTIGQNLVEEQITDVNMKMKFECKEIKP